MARVFPSTQEQLEKIQWIAQHPADIVIGIDEVGLGAWAGPVVVGGVVLQKDWRHPLCRDSKSLSASQRVKALQVIQESWLAAIVVGMEATDVDQIGVDKAVQQLTIQVATSLLHLYPKAIVVQDGSVPSFLPGEETHNVVWMPRADQQVAAVSAASILAKVMRDDDMDNYDEVFPGYAFKSNKGYHSADHVAGLEKRGPTPIHRFSYKPIRSYVVESEAWQSPRRKTGINVWTSYPAQ